MFLRSNLEFEVLTGATLVGRTNFAEYPSIPGWWEGMERKIYASMITGVDLENVAITGIGTLDGQPPLTGGVGKSEELGPQMGAEKPRTKESAGLPTASPRSANS
jgi:polygalacturonase